MTGFSFIVLFGVILWSTAHFMRHQIDDSVANEIDEIVTDPQSTNLANLASVVSGLARHSGGFHYLLQDSAGHVIAGNMPGLEPQVGIRELTRPPGVAHSRDRAIRGKGVAIDGGYLFVGWSAHQLREMEEMVTGSFIVGADRLGCTRARGWGICRPSDHAQDRVGERDDPRYRGGGSDATGSGKLCRR